MTIQEAIKEAHDCAKEHGFHNPSPSISALLALIITELSEALEADRRNRYFDDSEWSLSQIIDTLENNKDHQSIGIYKYWLKDTFESELADACIRIFDLAGKLSLEIWIPSIKLKEPDIPGNIMEAMSQIGSAYTVISNKAIVSTTDFKLSYCLGIIFAIAKKLDFDLWRHIQAEMKYNRLREAKHGKKY